MRQTACSKPCLQRGYSISSAFRRQALQSICEDTAVSLCSRGLFPFKGQRVLTLPVSSYHKQTHIASPPDPLITTLLSCRLSYVRLHNTRSVWVIFHNLGVPLHWHYHQIPSRVESKVPGRFGNVKESNLKANNSKLRLWGGFIATIIQDFRHQRLFPSFSWELQWRSGKGRALDTTKQNRPPPLAYHRMQWCCLPINVISLCFNQNIA